MRRIAYDEIDSTNSEAQRRIADGDITGWTLITGAIQTAGRGRLGRSWASPTGNFYGSFIIPKDQRSEWQRPWLLGAVAALAVADTAAAFVEDGSAIRLKWPNDVLVGGAKTAGLLLEGSGTNPFVVLGIGLNIAFAPQGAPYPVTALDRHRSTPAGLPAVTDALAALIASRVEGWLDGGFAALRARYLTRSHRPGEALSVQHGEQRIAGRFLDVDADGFLIMEVDGRERRFSTGDVFPTG